MNINILTLLIVSLIFFLVLFLFEAASIFLRTTLVLMSSFNPSGGGFLGGIYLSDYQ